MCIRDSIETSVSLFEVGMDSLMALELVMALESRLGIRLPEMALSEGPAVEGLARHIIRALRPDAAGEEPATPDALAQAVNAVAAKHSGEISAALVEQFSAELRAAGGPDAGSLTGKDDPGRTSQGAGPA